MDFNTFFYDKVYHQIKNYRFITCVGPDLRYRICGAETGVFRNRISGSVYPVSDTHPSSRYGTPQLFQTFDPLLFVIPPHIGFHFLAVPPFPLLFSPRLIRVTTVTVHVYG